MSSKLHPFGWEMPPDAEPQLTRHEPTPQEHDHYD